MPSASSRDLILLRIAEIFLKGKNRRVFFKAFVRHARRLVADLPNTEVEALYLRALVHVPASARPRALDRLHKLFGLASMSVATEADRSLEGLAETAIAAARALPQGCSFKIGTNRRDKAFPMRSPEISREVGHRVVEATGLRVDVRAPDHVINLEIGPERCLVFGRVIPGPGGLPVGVSGRVSLLLSGGIDSPVAGWSAMRRGCRVHAVYFHSFPYTGDKTREKVLDLARILAPWQGGIAVDVVDFTAVQKELRDAGPGGPGVLLYRRMMMRAACLLAGREGSTALVTGENLGQVASQTLQNLAVIEEAADRPILRPLVTYDKAEIAAAARRIGTFETSILPYEDCCSLFVPKHPATAARLSRLLEVEEPLDTDAMARGLADGAERFEIDG